MPGLELSPLPVNISQAISSSREAGFDFIIVPSSSPSQESIVKQELLMDNQSWTSWVVVRLCQHRGIDSKVDRIWRRSQQKLAKELSEISYLGLKQVIVRLNSGNNINLARTINSEILRRAKYEVWVEVGGEGWCWWNQFRLMTDSSDQVKNCLRLTEELPNDLQVERWLAEPLAAVSQYSPPEVILLSQGDPSDLRVSYQRSRFSRVELPSGESLTNIEPAQN